MALAGITLIGFKTLTKILEEIGLFKSKEAKAYEDQVGDPGSFWNPGFWRTGPGGTKLLTHEFCQWLYEEISDSFGIFDDNEDRIYAAFHRLTTQSQLSYFSYWVQMNKSKNLLSWLIGGNIGPVGDHLSAKEINKITDYFKQLPKYK